jgi:hypothetical protein
MLAVQLNLLTQRCAVLMQNKTAGNPSKCVRVEAPPLPGVPSQQLTIQRDPPVQARPERLEQPRANLSASALPPTRKTSLGKPDASPFPPLESVTRPTVETAAAAFYLNRRPQTLRIHACRETGALRPIRINGRLAWPVAELRRILGVA